MNTKPIYARSARRSRQLINDKRRSSPFRGNTTTKTFHLFHGTTKQDVTMRVGAWHDGVPAQRAKYEKEMEYLRKIGAR